MKFDIPTPIQEIAIPPALMGRDILGCAMTGSGKTAAFALPILQRILEKRHPRSSLGTKALILVPTRELALQIKEHIEELAAHTDIRVAAIFGGVGMNPQKLAFQSGVDILVATPGRLLDHFSYPYGRIPHLEFLVLDEADRMLDMGFLPDIRRVLGHLPKKPRQTMFFSATMPEPIVGLTRELLADPVALNIERISAPAEGIKQTAFPVPEVLKSKLLMAMFEGGSLNSVLAFTRTKHRAKRLAEFLNKHGVSCVALHGNLSQNQRTDAMHRFRIGKVQVMVATDIAARGIDVAGLSHVINFDVPHIPEDYIHRVGRTARAGMVGDAFTFVSSAEEFDLRGIERHLGQKLPRLQFAGFDYSEKKAEQLEIPLALRFAARAHGRRPAQGRNQPQPRSAAPRPESDSRPALAPKPNRPAHQAPRSRPTAPASVEFKTISAPAPRSNPVPAGRDQQPRPQPKAQPGSEPRVQVPQRHHRKGPGQRTSRSERGETANANAFGVFQRERARTVDPRKNSWG